MGADGSVLAGDGWLVFNSADNKSYVFYYLVQNEDETYTYKVSSFTLKQGVEGTKTYGIFSLNERQEVLISYVKTTSIPAIYEYTGHL